MATGFIPLHGGYKNLLTYQKAEIIYDATVYFTRRFFSKSDRTVDQMVQAARSGKQNIIEGSMASGTSKEMEVKLTNVARASLEELLEDYRDFLRINGYSEWPKEHPYAQRLRQINRTPGADYEVFRKGIEHEILKYVPMSLSVLSGCAAISFSASFTTSNKSSSKRAACESE